MSATVIGEILSVLMFFATIGVLMLGFPVAFTLASTALFFGVLSHLAGVFDYNLLLGLPARYFGTMINETLVAVPLFVFMGVMLERSRIAEQLLETMGHMFGTLRGGLGLSVIMVGAMLAASTGIVGATVVTMGLLSLPAMLRAGYDPKLATGVICASGTLGQIIPPSTVLIFIGDILQGANATAQMSKGNFTPDPVSVGDLFAGAFIPGFMLVGLYMSWVIVKAVLDPGSCPSMPMTDADRRNLGRRVAVVLVPPAALIIAVLGSILTGVATPTEAASVGAVCAMALAASRGLLTLRVLIDVMRSTMQITSMVFVILLGASVFSLVFRGMGGEELVHEFLAAMPGGAFGALFVVMAVMFLLGFFLDTFEIIFIVVPIAGPVLLKMDIDPIWLGVLIGVNLQTSFLTPPFGFSLFYLRGVAPPSVPTAAIYKGIIPFVTLQIAGLALIWGFPATATWLPNMIFRSEPPAAFERAPITGELEQPPEDMFDQPSDEDPLAQDPSQPKPDQ